MDCSLGYGIHCTHLGILLSEVRSISITHLILVLTHIHRQYTRASLPPDSNNKLDIFDRGYISRIWLYIFCGLLDAMWQTTAYWLMGAMSNDPAKLAYLTGFCA